MKQSMKFVYFILLEVSCYAKMEAMRMHADREMKVLLIAEFWRFVIVTEAVSTFRRDITAPAELNLGQFINAKITPKIPKT